MKAIIAPMLSVMVLAACSPAPRTPSTTESAAAGDQLWRPNPKLVRGEGPSPFGSRAALAEQKAIHAAEAALPAPNGLTVIGNYVLPAAHADALASEYRERFQRAGWTPTQQRQPLPLGTLNAWQKGSEHIAIVTVIPNPPPADQLLLVLRPR